MTMTKENKIQAAWVGVMVLLMTHFGSTIWFAANLSRNTTQNREQIQTIAIEVQKRSDTVYTTPVRVNEIARRLDKMEDTLQLIWQEVKSK